MSINTEMTALADAIRAKSGTSGKLSISGMTAAVNDIVINAGGDIDLSGVTVTADKMLSGIVAVGATGEKVTGNIQTVTATSDGTTVTVPVGYIAEQQTFPVGGGTSGGHDTSAVTVTSSGMLAGLVAIGRNGETITGTIPTVTASVSGDKVTVPVGYIAVEQTFDVGGSGIDTTTSVPPAAADVRLGKEFWANGAKYTGTMPDAVVSTETLDGGDVDTRLTISAGFLENDFTVDYLSSGFSYLPFITATAADIREGMVGADAEGNPITGTLVVGGDAPVADSEVYRCLEVVSHPDDITITSGTYVIRQESVPAGVGKILCAISLVGEYKLTNPQASDLSRVWVCENTTPLNIDGHQYASVKCVIRFVSSHGAGEENHPSIDTWVMYAVVNGHYNQVMCQNRETDSTDITPATVTDWSQGCRHYIMMATDFGDLFTPPEPNKAMVVNGIAPVMQRRGGNDVVWSGDALTFTGTGWESTGEVSTLTASGYVPIKGEAYNADTSLQATLYPDIAGEAEIMNGINIVKVTEFTPYSPAFNGVTEINVSGIGAVGEEDWGEDYSDANGKYIVTDATYYETDEKKRVYKHETKNYWLMCYDDTENYWYDGCLYWLIADSESEADPYSSVVCVAEDTLPVGMSEWYNYNYDTPIDVGISTVVTDKPEQPLVLNANIAREYDAEGFKWNFTAGTEHFNSYDIAPEVGEMFVTSGRKLVGGTLGHDPTEMDSNAVVFSDPYNDAGVAPQGIVTPYIHKAVWFGVPCAWFDTDAASDGIGTRESWAYLPLSKTLNFYSEQAQTQPVPFNTFSIIGTMYCETWGNTGSGVFRVTNKLDLSSYGERPSWDGIGVHFDPDYGFTIAGGWGHPSDYKKYYNAYNGKWAQFALIVDGYTAKLYINGELRVEACNFDYGSSNPAEIKYLCFRQPNDLYSTVYFGKMYVFDRVISETEIMYQYRRLNGDIAVAVCPTTFSSNTSIEGYVVDQSHGSGSYPDAYVVFNQRYDEPDYAWWSGDIGVTPSNPCWFSIELPEAVTPSSIMIMNEIESPQNFKTAIFQGSHDGSYWYDLKYINNSPDKAGFKQGYEISGIGDTAFKHFRMLFTESHASGVSVQAFQIYKKDDAR